MSTAYFHKILTINYLQPSTSRFSIARQLPEKHPRIQHPRYIYRDCLWTHSPEFRPECDGSLYGQRAPITDPAHQPGDWNTVYVRYEGSFLTAKINGVLIHDEQKVLDAANQQISGDINSSGPVRLQDHTGIISFRNMRIRPIHLPVSDSDKYPRYQPGTTLKVVVSSRLRSAPSEYAGTLSYTRVGDEVTTLEDYIRAEPLKRGRRSGHWIYVMSGNHRGYVFDGDLVDPFSSP